MKIMMRKRFRILFAVLMLFVGGGSAVNNQTAGDVRPCAKSLTVSMSNKEGITEFENGSILYEGYVYPPELYWHDNKSDTILGCVCSLESVKCFRRCCETGKVLHEDATCVDAASVQDEGGNDGVLIDISKLKIPKDNLSPEIKHLNDLEDHFYIIRNRICPSFVYKLEPESNPGDEFVLDHHGILSTSEATFHQDRYCIDWQLSTKDIRVVICFVDEPAMITTMASTLEMKLYPVGMIVSIPFLIATLFVYAIIAELRNLYGKTLMCYVACLIYAYSSLAVLQLAEVNQIFCVMMAFTIHFSFLSSFFWLNVMCFDIWWTFGGFRSLQGSIKQRERKKFLLYSIYAWGCASLLTAVCIIMDFAPGIPDSVLKPEFGVSSCWFKTEKAKALYFYGPMGVTVLCNIVLFISTAAKIIRHKKDTAHHLKGSDSKRHDDNKQWFNLYLKLFIVMGINWSMEIISWLCQGPKYLWYLTDIANSLQGVIIFIIFVWKEKIKRLLMKRFGCKGPNFLSRDSTKTYVSTASRTCTTSVPLQEKNNFTCIDPNSASASHAAAASRIKTLSDDSDGV